VSARTDDLLACFTCLHESMPRALTMSAPPHQGCVVSYLLLCLQDLLSLRHSNEHEAGGLVVELVQQLASAGQRMKQHCALAEWHFCSSTEGIILGRLPHCGRVSANGVDCVG
jgi:hypothetical protein